MAPESRLALGDHTATFNGTTVRYRVAGSGPILVVQAPGWGIGASPYITTFGRLEARFKVVYVNPRGSSGAPREAAATLQVGQFVEDLEALRRWLGLDDFALAGHSHGGLIALHYALRHPGRLRCLLLLAPQLVGVSPDPGERNAAVDPAQEPSIAQAYGYLEAVGGFARIFTARTDAEATAFLHGIAPLYYRDPRHADSLRTLLAAAPLPVHTLHAVCASDAAFPLDAAALRHCRVPTMVINGRYDVFCPPAPAKRLADTLPDARLRLFESSGHFPWLEEPEACFPAMESFLGKHIVIPAR